MDGERLAGGRKPPGSAAQGRVCHAAGIYQRAAHRAHPGGGAQGRRDGYILCFKSGSGLAREEIERPIDKKLFDELETKIIGKPLIGKIRRSYALPDGLVLEVNHVDEGQPTAFWYAEVEYPTVDAARSWKPEAFGLADYLNDDVTDQPGQSMGAYWEQTRK